MKVSKFFIRISDVGGTNDIYTHRYRSIFHEEPCQHSGSRHLVCKPDLYDEWHWISDTALIQQCYVQLKLKRKL